MPVSRKLLPNIERITYANSPYTIVSADVVFADSDGGNISVNIPAKPDGSNLKIINCGSSGNEVAVTPNGADLLFGDNAAFTLVDAEIIDIHIDQTEGWW